MACLEKLACSLRQKHGLSLGRVHVEQWQLWTRTSQIHTHCLSTYQMLGARCQLHKEHNLQSKSMAGQATSA